MSYFVDYEFHTSISGFGGGDFKASKLYSLCDDRIDTERVIEDILKVMKTQQFAIASVVHFTGFQSTDIMRFIQDPNGSMKVIKWNRTFSPIADTTSTEGVAVNKRTIRKLVNESIEMYCEAVNHFGE